MGSGPNGLSAAIVLAQAGLQVEVREAAPVPGGAARSGELTLPGFTHDLAQLFILWDSALLSSCRFRLQDFGLRWIFSPASVAHPFDDGTAVTLERDIGSTPQQLGATAAPIASCSTPFVEHCGHSFQRILRPLPLPHPFLMARFGLRAVQP